MHILWNGHNKANIHHKKSYFFIEEFQLINAEEMIALEKHDFTNNEILSLDSGHKMLKQLGKKLLGNFVMESLGWHCLNQLASLKITKEGYSALHGIFLPEKVSLIKPRSNYQFTRNTGNRQSPWTISQTQNVRYSTGQVICFSNRFMAWK